MSPDDKLTELVEKMVLMNFVLQQKDWVIMCLLARLGCEAKLSSDELDFVRRTYEMDEAVSLKSQVLSDVYMRLKLKV